MANKDENYWKVLNSAIYLDIRVGHQKWTMTQLSRHSKVSRTLIYYYFGKSKVGILLEAISLFGSEFSGSTPERIESWKAGRFGEGFEASRRLMRQLPELLPFYFLNRPKPTEVGESIRSKEKIFLKKISDFFPFLEEADRELMFSVCWGLVMAPEVSDQAIANGEKLMKSWFLATKN